MRKIEEPPLWSILIATLASREVKFLHLLSTLLPQAEKAGRVEVVACHNNGEIPLGEIRQNLLLSARGVYTSFIDDDDSIEDDFVSDIVTALQNNPGVDVIGFNMTYWEDQRQLYISHHSLQFEPYDDVTNGKLFRDVSHQQPVLTRLSRQADYRSGWPEDYHWKVAVRPLLQTEVYLDKVLYHYRHSWSDTVQGHLRTHTYTPRPVIESPVFRWLELPGRTQ